MSDIHGGGNIPPIVQKQNSLHELINTILDKLPLGVFVKDAEDNFKYLYWNHFMKDITGIDMKEVEGHNDFELRYNTIMSPEQRLILDHDIMKTGKTVEFNGTITDTHGIRKYIEVTKFPITLSNGKSILLAFWRDVTAHNSMENILRRSQMLTKMALYSNDIRLCSIFVNPDSKRNYDDSVVQVNNWVPTKEDELINISWLRFASRVHPEDRARHDEAFRKLCRGELSEIKIELRVKYPGMADYHWRESSAFVYERDKEGRAIIILGSTINIQERKGQELNLEEARHKAELADKMKSKYLADMSHEIRTPLNAITGFSELMAFADSDEERQGYYEIIKANNQLLMQLINDILDLSKIEADAIKISYAPVDINDLMDTTYASIKLRMPEGVQLFLEKGSDACTFGTDSIRLLQLINNLVNNAIKNTREGSITMGYSCLPDHRLKFYVKDTGIGIAEDKLETLFTRFVKVNDYVEGIGLGLAICQGLVTKMGGSMHVESKLGIGSTFSFILPSHDE
ncbi:ATP-binding protein [uncultured Parabacteroides sp.]|uniref:PAS domain-containing sensor histidine kinase n=1 Tax=uncultured Parabacteroides sp. TaxID=512312 RepID=UPI0025EACD06|nr:ATP-binding protein [uncultured Parabacteroides sp.]